MNSDEFERIQRQFEIYHSLNVLPDCHIIIRVDGRAFHTLTADLAHPFDTGFAYWMAEATEMLMSELGGIYAHQHSDEISVLLPRNCDLFNRSVEKLVSISASIASVAFSNTRNRGRLGIEISIRDKDIIFKLQNILPCSSTISYRTRDTNFADDYESICLNVFDLTFRRELIDLGIPVGYKSDKVFTPKVQYDLPSYIRGYVDGNGSLGFTANGYPFISVTTYSDSFAKDYLRFISKVSGVERHSSRNKRDNIYNIGAFKEQAQVIASALYGIGGIYLDRKYQSFLTMLEWERPITMRRRTYPVKEWNQDEDQIALNNPAKTAAQMLNRTLSSVNMRVRRLSMKEVS